MKRMAFAAVLLLIAAGCVRRPAPAAGAAPPKPAALPPYEMRLGRDIFQHYCQTCHGETGGGDGFNAFNLDPRPRDISDPAFQKKKTDAEFADAIQRGGAGVGLSALMPPWGRTLSRAEVDQVVLYIRSLSSASRRSAS